MIFALLNRKQFPDGKNHPLLTQNPHNLVPILEYSSINTPSFPSRRFFATHTPYVSLPESLKSNSSCKIVYVCRNAKDTFVSLWHFINKLRIQANPIEQDFEMFCNGLSLIGPFWDHVLEYWKLSKEDPDRVIFLKYEDMKEQPGIHFRRLADFLGCSFTGDEEESGRVEEIVKLCSFDHMKSLEVNKNGTMPNGMENKDYFRKGEIGDWKNYLSAEMADKIDKIAQEKLFGSGLVL